MIQYCSSICEQFSGQNALYGRILHIQSRNFFQRWYRRNLAEAPPVFGPRHQFPLGSPAFPLFLFYVTTTGRGAILGNRSKKVGKHCSHLTNKSRLQSLVQFV